MSGNLNGTEERIHNVNFEELKARLREKEFISNGSHCRF